MRKPAFSNMAAKVAGVNQRRCVRSKTPLVGEIEAAFDEFAQHFPVSNVRELARPCRLDGQTVTGGEAERPAQQIAPALRTG